MKTVQTAGEPVDDVSKPSEFERAIGHLKEAQSLLDKVGAAPEICARLQEVISAAEDQAD